MPTIPSNTPIKYARVFTDSGAARQRRTSPFRVQLALVNIITSLINSTLGITILLMTNRERFHKVMNFQPVDRLPVVEWAPWWDKTLDRWHSEGLPSNLITYLEVSDCFELEYYTWFWPSAIGPDTPKLPRWGWPRANDEAEYHEILPTLYPDLSGFPMENSLIDQIKQIAERAESGEIVVRLIFDGYFWHPREILGIERHLYAFYDQPDLIHEINRNLLAFQLRVLDTFCDYCEPDMVVFAEDMSYNHGPMLSQELFDEFIAPYYRQLIPHIHDRGIIPFVDSDGNVHDLVPWFDAVGVKGILPLERQAGVDVALLRQQFPDLRMMGAFDKMVMTKGEAAMRAEFERVLPVMRSGGYIPSVDHQTPPGVSLDDYRLYLTLLREYAAEAAS